VVVRIKIKSEDVPRTFDVLNTNGGHIVVGFCLMLLGGAFFKFGIPKGEDLIVVGMTLIARAMMDQHATWTSPPPQKEKETKDGS
jgi:hypothetical protein